MRTARVVMQAFVLLLLPVTLSASVGIDDVNSLLSGPGEVKFQVTWHWPPWGANMRVEYGPTASYGQATNWVSHEEFPFAGTSEFVLTGLPDGPLHYRVVITPKGGPPGATGYTSADMVITPVSNASGVCRHNCPEADANCRSQCIKDPAYYDRAVAACRSKCRADDPDCSLTCQQNLGYVSKPPTMTTMGPSHRCASGWRIYYNSVEMNYNCHPLGSDFCKGNQSYWVQFTTVCATPKDKFGKFQTTVHQEKPCLTRRGAATPVPRAGETWEEPQPGAWICTTDKYDQCKILCPQ